MNNWRVVKRFDIDGDPYYTLEGVDPAEGNQIVIGISSAARTREQLRQSVEEEYTAKMVAFDKAQFVVMPEQLLEELKEEK